MREPPPLQAQTILAQLNIDYDLTCTQLAFLPLGADSNTAVYQAQTAEGKAYFVKVRLADFRAASVTIPNFLVDQGFRAVIPAIITRSGELWASLGDHHVILYPFVMGQTGYAYGMSRTHWAEFGAALYHLHTTVLPDQLATTLGQETFTPEWPARMRLLLAQIAKMPTAEPIVRALIAFLQGKARELHDIVTETEQLAGFLHAAPPPFVLCHGDMHGWNLLIDTDEQLFIIDWDTLILAPKERDLMFIGGGHGDSGYSAAEEESLFHHGYGQEPINGIALAYYRFARALEDIVLFAEQILTTNNGDDRHDALRYLQSNFLPGSTIARAYHALYHSSISGQKAVDS